MPSIDTLRLRIFPLTPEQVRLWVEDLPALERELGYSYRGIPLEERPLEALRRLLAQAEGDPCRQPYCTPWMLVHKEDRTIIGSAGFQGRPDSRGEVEISYAMGPAYSPSRGWRISPPRPIWSAIPPSGSWSGWASRSTAMRRPCGGAYENLGRGSRRGTYRSRHL